VASRSPNRPYCFNTVLHIVFSRKGLTVLTAASLCLLLSAPAADPEPKAEPKKGEPNLNGFKLRLLGPATMSGRVVGFAVHPKNRSHYFVAVASGGVWKTVNDGTTWTPVFDNEGSYSIGYITLDPKDPNVVWVGTGENNSQRSVGYGDGVYKSIDGGKSWQNVGLKNSEHIGKIIIDPRDSDTIYVAAQGPLWGSGGDRGLFKSTDGGKTWNKVLNISENTGVTDVVMDPRNPDVLIAAAYQRRRHVWTLINGGPEGALYRSTDAGKNWTKLKSGLPEGDIGRIGLAMAPTDPDTVYAIIEAADKKGGIFRSTDRGVTWEKRNPFDRQAQYYSHLVVDPKNKDRLYVMSVLIQVSDDGGKTLKPLGEKWKHVDNHTIWIDPADTDFYRVGCDGGIYESHDRASNWHFKSNLPVTQFYDVTCDESGPFYHVYGGTQDNDTLGGPARTRSDHGIMNQDWFVVQGGDGFQCKVDPKDPNIVYGESQYAGLVRYDRRTGQRVGIQPEPGKGEPPLRWNWDSPLILSPHLNTRLYFAANRLYRSDDCGDSWTAISADLSRQIDRDTLAVMGKVWGPDAVAKHLSTSLYGNCTALTESPKKEGRLYIGTDDGLIHLTSDGGNTWKKLEQFPGIPDRTYVARLLASQHDSDTVYAAFDNHKNADFKPYLLKSTDAGKTWTSIVGDLPERGSVLAIAEDHVKPQMLFAGTEFGLFVTLDGGKKWQRLKGGFPTIAVRDIVINRPMNDLVVGTFGRGIYVLDDYSALRELAPEKLKEEAILFPARDAVVYVPSQQYGLKGKAFLGESFYTAENPPFGATFTYFLKDGLKSKKQLRQEAEKKGVVKYPTKDELRAEAEEEEPAILLKVSGERGGFVRIVTGPTTAGFNRISWDLRDSSIFLKARANEEYGDLFGPEGRGPLVAPGQYSAFLVKRIDGKETQITPSVKFNVVSDKLDPVPEEDRLEMRKFQKDVAKLQRAVHAAVDASNDLNTKLEAAKKALDQVEAPAEPLKEEVRRMIREDRDLLRLLRGDVALRTRNENTPMSTVERIDTVVETLREAIAKPTKTQRDGYRIASEEFGPELERLKKLVETDLKALEKELERIGAPYTPGRLPEWKEKGK
jgi:photosystem II stability/assembly factor-like uncharacterized protein